jgi:hypothetical protein
VRKRVRVLQSNNGSEPGYVPITLSGHSIGTTGNPFLTHLAENETKVTGECQNNLFEKKRSERCKIPLLGENLTKIRVKRTACTQYVGIIGYWKSGNESEGHGAWHCLARESAFLSVPNFRLSSLCCFIECPRVPSGLP